MNPTIEITGVRIRRALVPVKRVLNTRVGRFTKGPFLLIDWSSRAVAWAACSVSPSWP